MVRRLWLERSERMGMHGIQLRGCNDLRGGARRGFTLLEASVVIALTGILAVSVIPAVNTMSQSRAAAAANEVERRLTHARAMAIAQGKRVGVSVDTATETVQTVALSGTTVVGARKADGQLDAGVGLKTLFKEADVVTVTSGGSGLTSVWFDFAGTPCTQAGSRLTSDVVIAMGDGAVVTVRAYTGAIER